MKDDMHAVQNE